MTDKTEKKIEDLKSISKEIRKKIIEVSHITNTPHLGTCLSCVDLLVVLYFSQMNIDPANPTDEDRDRFILSKGHAAPALYPVLALRGFFPENILRTCNTNGSPLGEHPLPNSLAGIEAATGSLGHGLGVGLGMALESKIHHRDNHVYVLLGDGECNEGSIWEAAMFAPAHKLDNVTVLVDYNKWQATGRSNEIMSLSPLKEKWTSFGWATFDIDGHDISQIDSILSKTRQNQKGPVAIIANTTKGKGVSFMEDDNNWHYRIPNKEEVDLSDKELR